MVKSPCVKICKLDQNVCIGCLRTISEIADWNKMSDKDKAQIIDRIEKMIKPV